MKHFLRVAPLILAVLCSTACRKPDPDPPPPVIPAEVKSGTTFTATPDPIIVDDGGPLGETTLHWSTTANRVEVHIASPGGQLFGGGGAVGSLHTGKWVNNGMTFFLQDMSNPNPASAEATLGKLQIVVQ